MNILLEYLLNETPRFKQWYHISFNPKLDLALCIPQVPSNIKEYLDDIISGRAEVIDFTKEDMDTPRFCMAETIEGCLNGFGKLKLLQKYPYIKLYVYRNKYELQNYLSSEYLTTNRLVFDAHHTKEIWVTEPIHLEKVGEFKLSKDNIILDSAYAVHPFNDITLKKDTHLHMYKYKNLPMICK